MPKQVSIKDLMDVTMETCRPAVLIVPSALRQIHQHQENDHDEVIKDINK